MPVLVHKIPFTEPENRQLYFTLNITHPHNPLFVSTLNTSVYLYILTTIGELISKKYNDIQHCQLSLEIEMLSTGDSHKRIYPSTPQSVAHSTLHICM